MNRIYRKDIIYCGVRRRYRMYWRGRFYWRDRSHCTNRTYWKGSSTLFSSVSIFSIEDISPIQLVFFKKIVEIEFIGDI